MAAMLAMQAMGFPVPGLPPFGQQGGERGPGGPKKKRCRDYDQKGFCARGNTCMFEHGQDSIYVPSANASDEYDPSNAGLLENFRGADRGRGRGGFRGDRGHNPSRRGGRAEFSSDKPNFDKSKTTIVVENIPEEKFSEDEVKGFFSEFGEILEVSMRPYKRLAVVKFSDWNAAKAAYSSPKVIFDNRFVKVYWYTDQESLPQPPSVATSRSPNGAPSANGAQAPAPTPEPQIDIEEFARKQQEVQKAHEEKAKKKLEMEAARKELEKRQEDLLKSQAEEKKKLMEKIAAKSGKPAADGAESPAETKTNTQTELLRAQLATLEAEAQSLGIDPSAATDDSWGGRGRGRGRGGYRGRGAFVPRGFRGGYRGRGGGAAFGGGSAYKLDNRPKTVGVSGIDFTDPEKDEGLRQYLLVSFFSFFTMYHNLYGRTTNAKYQGIGDFTSIETTSARTAITFRDRFTAEKFMYGTPGGELPGVGKAEFAWIQTPLPPVSIPGAVNAATAAITPTTSDRVDMSMEMDEGDAMAQEADSPATATNSARATEQQERNLDYDVADDNDWGVQ
jgi:hypothetical protein